MTPEEQLAAFIVGFQAEHLPPAAARIAQWVLLAATGPGVAGAQEEGIAPLRSLLLARGGAAQARCLVFGDVLPAAAAAQLNGTMCRALDFCDAMAPGPHFGSAVVPVAFAVADMRVSAKALGSAQASAVGLANAPDNAPDSSTGPGTCTGLEFQTALALGCEIGARFNLTETQYDGFDPTGVAAVFAATATAARLLRLDRRQTVHALGLAFNRCGGSFQSHIDGSLAVRLVQGFVAAAGVECAQLAQAGLTGPVNFLAGVYGYAHLYGRGRLAPAEVVAGLGSEWRLTRTVFKKYPSCGATQGLTELTLGLMADLQLAAPQVRAAQVRLNPYCHKLVGHTFSLGENPRVNAQFSAQYCVANALLRGASRLAHFRPEQVADAAVLELAQRVTVQSCPELDPRGHTAVDLILTLADGRRHERSLDIAPGFPGHDLSHEQHLARFADCMAYAPWPLPAAQAQRYVNRVQNLPQVADACRLLDLLLVPQAGRA
jgi:2-methylcitrate dehydratase PrpD